MWPQMVLVGILVGILGGYLTLDPAPPWREGEATIPSPRSESRSGAQFPSSGIWEGTWQGGLPTRLIVEAAEEGEVTVLYAWGVKSSGPLRGGWEQARAAVQPDGSIRWGHPGTFSFRLAPDGQSLEGEYTWGGRLATIRMLRAL